MAEFVLKYADASGVIHNQVTEAPSEQEIRDRLTQQGFLVYSVKPRGGVAAGMGLGRKKLNLEKFLIFNQQFVTLIKAGGGIPQVEVGAYRYTGDWLPEVGETIVIRPAAAPDEAGPELQGFVTKVNPVSDTPISVVEVESQGTLDDVVLPPGGSGETY